MRRWSNRKSKYLRSQTIRSLPVLLVLLLCWATTYLGAQTSLRYEFEHRQMGTLFRIVLFADDDSLATCAARAAFARIDSLNACLSDYLPESELSRLPAMAVDTAVLVSDELWSILNLAQNLAGNSAGAFDLTIGPLSKLWRRAFRQQQFPDELKITQARDLVGYQKLDLLSGQQVRFRKAGIRLDAGGIAKGFAVDEAMALLRQYGINRALVDGGGDILTGEAPPNKPGWKIQAKTVDSGGILKDTVLFLRHGALATSGDTYKFLEWEGHRYSHIIDPRTGLGVDHEALVTVFHPTCTLADALASTASVIGPEGQWEKLTEYYPGSKIHFIYPDSTGLHRQLGNLIKKTIQE